VTAPPAAGRERGSQPVPRAPGPLLRLHRWLIPGSRDLGITPYLWLFYLASFYVLYFFAPASGLERALAILTGVVFLGLYFDGFRGGGGRGGVLRDVVGILALGVVWLPFNFGAMTFFVYAGAFLGAVAPARTGRRFLAGIYAVLMLEWWLVGAHWSVAVFGGPATLLVGLTNIHHAEVRRKDALLRQSQQEVQRLATVAERERIARDLHDLLGHTLSVVALKSDLAARLVERADERVADEIRDVQRISRDALKQVREAVSGYRGGELRDEIRNAHLACEAAGIRLEPEIEPLVLARRQEQVLSMTLREAVTNVVRHSGGERCRVSLRPEAACAVLRVSDDGRGGAPTPGSGLEGMRARLESAGGRLELRTDDGFTVEARLPLAPAAGDAA